MISLLERAPRIVAVSMLAGLLTATGCRSTSEPLVVDRARITLINQTREEWRNVELKLNGYYAARSDALAPGARVDAPIDRFQNGFGRYFDPSRERVREVVVTATTARGEPIRLTWPTPVPR
jgi:hypothetical protein